MWRDFDPNEVTPVDGGIYGLPFTMDEAQIALIPAPWGVTVSYGGGTHNGPQAIFDAAPQIDFYHESYGADSWKIGIAMLPMKDWRDAYNEGVRMRADAERVIEGLREQTHDPEDLRRVNDACEGFHVRIEAAADELLSKKKLVGVVGGDHSTPLGLMRALAKRSDFGILQIDAHCDLREAYEGFVYSHASIMHNALKLPEVRKLVQVGVRDYSIGEKAAIDASGGRIETFFDTNLKSRIFDGETWNAIADDIIRSLPQNVYISFDIDGLDPALCPGTGTPVPGGLQFDQALALLQAVARSGRRIVGFDLNEVSPREGSEWDANVGMRVLWNLVLWAAKSNGLEVLH